MKKSFYLMLGMLFIIPIQSVRASNDVVQTLKQAVKNKDGNSFLGLIREVDDFIPVMQKLMDSGVNAYTTLNFNEDGKIVSFNLFDVLLSLFALEGSLEEVQFLVENGADVNSIDPTEGYTPLHYAAENNELGMVEYLLEKGAKINASGLYNGKTPLMIAAGINDPEIFNVMLQHGADILTAEEIEEAQMIRENTDYSDNSDDDDFDYYSDWDDQRLDSDSDYDGQIE